MIDPQQQKNVNKTNEKFELFCYLLNTPEVKEKRLLQIVNRSHFGSSGTVTD